MLYRTLVIAPRTNLTMAEDEISAVVNALNANVLQGMVTANQVLDKISEGWDIIWFMTHGVKGGLMLSDGLISAATLTTFVRTSEARLVVLNSCESIQVALAIHNELLTNLICTLREIPDKDAYFVGKQLAMQLARGKSFSQSYLASKPGQNTDYIFLVGKEDAQARSSILSTLPAISVGAMPNTRGSDEDYAEQIKRLEEIIKGDNNVWGPGLVATVRSILTEINDIKRAILVIQIAGAAITVIAFLILITIIIIFFR